MNKDRHLGRFDVSIQMIDEYPDTVRHVMKDIIVIKAECICHKDCIRYVGISEKLFGVVKIGHEIPKYQLITNENNKSVIANRLY